MGIHTTVSTNASIIPAMDEEGLRAVDRVLISLPGFSQESYDRIHGFNFERIKANILELQKVFKGIPFDMSYHIYQFNLNEIEAAKRFCDRNNIRFALNYAIMIDKNKCLDYVNNRMDYKELKKISQEVMLGLLERQIAASPKNYCDFQSRFLSVTAEGNVNICASYSRDYWSEIDCGNLLTDHIDEIIERKYYHKKCDLCISSGLALEKGYDCKIWPDFYYSEIKENTYLRRMIKELGGESSGYIDSELALIHQIRYWEQAHFQQEELERIVGLFQKSGITLERLKELIRLYARFGINSYERIKEYMD